MKEIVIMVCFDENYALNGVMTVYSAAQNIKEGTRIKAYVIDGGVKKKTRRRFEKLAKNNLEIIWLNPDLSVFDNLPLSPWTTKVNHARLLISYIIQGGTEKLLYLDSDMLVLRDITGLWDIPMDDNVFLAVQDFKYPFVRNKPNFKSLIDAGMNLSSPYFNAGLLLVDISRWKNTDVLRRYIKLLSEPHRKFTHCNQDSLNIILENKWKSLEQHWQVPTSCFNFSGETYHRIIEDAFIIHFTGIPPGFAKCSHPRKVLFYEYVYKSGWFSGWEYFGWRCKLLIKFAGYAVDSIQQKLVKKLLNTHVGFF